MIRFDFCRAAEVGSEDVGGIVSTEHILLDAGGAAFDDIAVITRPAIQRVQIAAAAGKDIIA